jgi:hypothetical protein
MHTLNLAGQSWHVLSPSRLRLLGYQGTITELAFNGTVWHLVGHPGGPIPCPSRDTGAQWLANALAGASRAAVLQNPPT